ncbi:uncharacterized protein LOC128990905 [Macrosteles quadrilineatus]|uniref:uncharacterized protein LOC128990905 n=1 Tax=Macrosteles quadrilineatus TaxID=74068 RepID=UPI0023E2FA63|nr:uncharacterized protein LOC128990905 [Macrosteles quadrilineatus]
MDPFLTTYNDAYGNPTNELFVERPSPPPEVTKPPGALEVRPAAGVCTCDRHDWNIHFDRAKHLRNTEDCLMEKLLHVRKERKLLDNAILHHPCGDMDEKMKTMYQISYEGKGSHHVPYRSLQVDRFDPVAVPVPMIKTGFTNGYRDPNSFRYNAIEKSQVFSPRPIEFTAEPVYEISRFIGRSEYQDTYSKMGLSNMLAMQQYREPLPSSRRRLGERCI